MELVKSIANYALISATVRLTSCWWYSRIGHVVPLDVILCQSWFGTTGQIEERRRMSFRAG